MIAINGFRPLRNVVQCAAQLGLALRKIGAGLQPLGVQVQAAINFNLQRMVLLTWLAILLQNIGSGKGRI